MEIILKYERFKEYKGTPILTWALTTGAPALPQEVEAVSLCGRPRPGRPRRSPRPPGAAPAWWIAPPRMGSSQTQVTAGGSSSVPRYGSEGRHLGIIVNDVYVYREMPIPRSVGEACILTPSPIIVTGLLPQIVMEDL